MKEELNKQGRKAELIVECEDYKYVIFYENEIAEVDLGRKFVKKKKKEFKNQLKEEGVGMLRRVFQVEELWGEYIESYYAMEVKEIEVLHKDVYRIPYSEIKRAFLNGYVRGEDYGDGPRVGTMGDIVVEGKGESVVVEHQYTRKGLVYKEIVEAFAKHGIKV